MGSVRKLAADISSIEVTLMARLYLSLIANCDTNSGGLDSSYLRLHPLPAWAPHLLE